MVQKAKNYILQYKVLFYLSWICLYLIFPSWISLHSIFQGKDLLNFSSPIARSLVILGFVIYFSISAFLINRYFTTLTVDKPVIMKINDWLKNIKENVWLVIFCCLAVVLHIYSFFFVEVGFLNQGLWMYDFSNRFWHRLFESPIQYGFWSFVVLLILIIRQKKTINYISNYISVKFTEYNNLLKFFFILSLFGLFSLYSYLFPYSREDSLQLLRFPPVSHFLYLVTYYAFGISHIGPRILQLIFYILSAVYLYRTIHLFREKETALLGATIYLFSPVMFHYASLTFLESGTTFFMILISFYFLKFIKDEDDRDLILTSYFIGIAFMYSRIVQVVFIVCFSYLVFSRIKKRDWHSIIHFKILLLSLITVLPFYMIGGREGLNFYGPALSNLLSPDYIFLVIQSQLSFILSFLLVFSIIFIFFTKKDDLSLFYGLYFIAYYVFLTLKLGVASQRYSMALYPAVAVLIAQFIFSITQRVRYKHFFKLFFSILTVYLIFLCLVPRSSTNFISFKYMDFETQQYPIEKATDWIKENTGANDKILVLLIPDYEFYVKRIYEDTKTLNPNRFVFLFAEEIKELNMPNQKLKQYFVDKNGSYIMFSFSAKGAFPFDRVDREMITYLKENKNNEFTEVSIFNLEDNYILIYKLKEKRPD